MLLDLTRTNIFAKRLELGNVFSKKKGRTHCNPTRLNVNRAMRVDSVRPLMDGEPTHDAACGMAAVLWVAYSSAPPLCYPSSSRCCRVSPARTAVFVPLVSASSPARPVETQSVATSFSWPLPKIFLLTAGRRMVFFSSPLKDDSGPRVAKVEIRSPGSR